MALRSTSAIAPGTFASHPTGALTVVRKRNAGYRKMAITAYFATEEYAWDLTKSLRKGGRWCIELRKKLAIRSPGSGPSVLPDTEMYQIGQQRWLHGFFRLTGAGDRVKYWSRSSGQGQLCFCADDAVAIPRDRVDPSGAAGTEEMNSESGNGLEV